MTLFELRADYLRRTMHAMEKKAEFDSRLKKDQYEYESQRVSDAVEYSRLSTQITCYETITSELERLSL